MIRWSYSQWFTAAATAVAWIGSATIAINVAHGVYPAWAAWSGFLLSVPGAAGLGILTYETRASVREETKIHRLGG